MSTNGVNQSAATPKTAADFKPEELQNARKEKVLNTIFELDEAIKNDVAQMEADNVISSDVDAATGKSEVDRIYDWVNVIDGIVGSMSSQVKQSCKEGLQTLKGWVANLIDLTGMGQYRGQNIKYDGDNVTINEPQEEYAYEPDDVDADLGTEEYIQTHLDKTFGAGTTAKILKGIADSHEIDDPQDLQAKREEENENRKSNLAKNVGQSIIDALHKENDKFHNTMTRK